jgi:DNA-binding helix-hairpin-helix protein with protein kinase domain
MTQNRPPALVKVAAWPIDTLHERPAGPVVGFTMPALQNAKPIHCALLSRTRARDFPGTGWRFLVHVARNVAAAFDTMHAQGHVVGDVNESNLFVTREGFVRFIDCDSFQIAGGGRTFRCGVGKEEYTPPELQGVQFSSVTRTANHDRFGLAVLLFRLLFMGRHPFLGIWPEATDLSLGDAIKGHRFAYGRLGHASGWKPPPFTLPFSILSHELQTAFEDSFARQASTSLRTSADRWLSLLIAFGATVTSCAAEPAHEHPSGMSTCPWCAFEDKGAVFFVGAGGRVFVCTPEEVEPLKIVVRGAARRAVPDPPAPPNLAKRQPAPEISKALLACRAASWLKTVFGAAAIGLLPAAAAGARWAVATLVPALFLGLCGIWIDWWRWRKPGYAGEAANRKKAEHSARERAKELSWEWQLTVANTAEPLRSALQDFEVTSQEYARLQQRYDSEIRELARQKEESQRKDFLSNRLIEDYKIKGIGPQKLQTLLSFGIESAYDVLQCPIDNIPGLPRGGKLFGNLYSWAQSMRLEFRFDPRASIAESERARIVSRFDREKRRLRQVLQDGATKVQQQVAERDAQLAGLRSRMEQANRDWAEAHLEWSSWSFGDRPLARRWAAAAAGVACLGLSIPHFVERPMASASVTPPSPGPLTSQDTTTKGGPYIYERGRETENPANSPVPSKAESKKAQAKPLGVREVLRRLAAFDRRWVAIRGVALIGSECNGSGTFSLRDYGSKAAICARWRSANLAKGVKRGDRVRVLALVSPSSGIALLVDRVLVHLKKKK